MYIPLENFGSVLIWVITGALAGAAASFLVRGRSRGPVWDVVTGLIGAVIGGLIVNWLNIPVPSFPIAFDARDLIIAFFGALIFVILLRVLFRR